MIFSWWVLFIVGLFLLWCSGAKVGYDRARRRWQLAHPGTLTIRSASTMFVEGVLYGTHVFDGDIKQDGTLMLKGDMKVTGIMNARHRAPFDVGKSTVHMLPRTINAMGFEMEMESTLSAVEWNDDEERDDDPHVAMGAF